METHWTILPPGNTGVTTEPVTASDKTEDLLRALIFSGQLGPGDKLPSERELATQLRTSRPTLRTALRALEALGFIKVKIGSKGGFWINDAETISRRWHDWMRANQGQIEEMLDFRRWVELEIARHAAERRTVDDVKILEACCVPPNPDRLSLVKWHFGLQDRKSVV
jgi:GntR family transcriptional repressor for pyruvate dehydrogenase complex